MAASNIDIIIQAQDKTAQAFNSASGGLSSFQGKLESLKPTFEKMAAVGTVAFAGITAFVGKSVMAYAESERAQRQLETAIVRVSKGTMEQVEQISNLTDALQKKVGLDGDALKVGSAQLATFGLQSQSVVDLTKSIADLTINQKGLTGTADDYTASANLMAKALRGEFGRLEQMGIVFNEAQQNTIKFGTETEKVAAVIDGFQKNMKETTETIGGLDVAIAKAKMAFGEIQENIGRGMSGAFDALLGRLEPFLTKIMEWTEENPKLVQQIVTVAMAVSGLIAVMGIIGIALPAVIAGFTALSGPVGLIALAIAGLVAGFMAFREHLGGIMAWLENVGILDYFRQIWDNISTVFRETLVPAFQRFWEILVKLKPLFEIIGMIVGGALLVAIMAFAKVLEWTITLLAGLFDIASKVAKFFADVFVGAFNVVKDAVQWLIEKFNALISTIKSLIATAEKIGGNILGSIGGAISNIFKVNDAVISPSGNVISTHPDDYLIATKDPSSLVGGGGVTVNLNGGTFLDPNVASQIGDMIIGKLNLNMRGS